jgi:hypothetical protein
LYCSPRLGWYHISSPRELFTYYGLDGCHHRCRSTGLADFIDNKIIDGAGKLGEYDWERMRLDKTDCGTGLRSKRTFFLLEILLCEYINPIQFFQTRLSLLSFLISSDH